MKLFKRNLKLIIGSDTEAIIIKEPLAISIVCVKDMKVGEADYANVTITNLSRGTRDKLNSEYQKIKIVGGYGDQEDLIFFGQIIASTHKKGKTEWTTTIECGDSIQALDQSIVNKTYDKGFKMTDIIKDFANLNDISIESMIGMDDNFALPRGKSFTGSMKDSLDQMGNSAGFDWSMQDGKLVIVKRGSSRETFMQVISARTGMVGSPEWINTGTDNAKTIETKGVQFKVVSLCLPSLKPADKILVKSESLEGKIGNYIFNIKKEPYETTFTVTKIQHDLNSRDGNFTTTIECTLQDLNSALKAPIKVS